MQVENSRMIYRGTNELARVYRGTTIVWEPGSGDPYYNEYLTFEVVGSGDGTFDFLPASGFSGNIQISKNDGPWIDYYSATTEDRTISTGGRIRVKGNNYQYSGSRMLIDGGTEYYIYGNIMSLLYGDSFTRKRTLYDWNSHCFSELFDASTAKYRYCTSAENLVLPATKLSDGCYDSMFRLQTRLEHAPKLPATTLADSCYIWMFRDCSSLLAAPYLPAKTMKLNCYSFMFLNCSSITSTQETLPTTKLAAHCYRGMFQGCSSLTTAPVMLETEINPIPNTCYQQMFSGCTSLNYIKCMEKYYIGQDNFTNNWVSGVAPTGTFVRNTDARWAWGDGGIPSGWTVVYASA